MVIKTENENGNPSSLNIAICRTPETKNNLKEAPIVLDNKKKKNLFYRYINQISYPNKHR